MKTTSAFRRNFLMHIYPVHGRGMWQWNVAQALRRMSQFNGRRVVSIVTDDQTDNIDEVRRAFCGEVKEFITHKNDPKLGETLSFVELMRRIENTNPDEATFYCHAKGVRYKVGEKPLVRRWTAVMYATLLDYPTLVDQQLRTHPITGAFFKAGPGFQKMGANWHYSGTFFWLRNASIFSQSNWSAVPTSSSVPANFGVEAWPGIICPEDRAGRMFYVHRGVGGHLYQKEFWEKNVNPAWHKWQLHNTQLHRHSSYHETLNALRVLGHKKIIVTGPQRSGTTIASKMLAKDLGLTNIPEEAFQTYDFAAFQNLINSRDNFVIQAPTMSAYAHLLPGAVVWMHRDLAEIIRSQKRVGWEQYEQMERNRYFDHSNRPAAVIKREAWEKFQRETLGERAFEMSYASLEGHPLWVDAEARKTFTSERQTEVEKHHHHKRHCHHKHHHHHCPCPPPEPYPPCPPYPPPCPPPCPPFCSEGTKAPVVKDEKPDTKISTSRDVSQNVITDKTLTGGNRPSEIIGGRSPVTASIEGGIGHPTVNRITAFTTTNRSIIRKAKSMTTISVVNHSTVDLGLGLNELIEVGHDFLSEILSVYWPGTNAVLVSTKKILPRTQAIILMDDFAQDDNTLGYGSNTPDGLPLHKLYVRNALRRGQLTTVEFTHGLAELRTDPGVNMTAVDKDGTVYALECADPVEGIEAWVASGHQVTNVVTPAWFQPYHGAHNSPRGDGHAGSPTKFDHSGTLVRPFHLAQTGYIVVLRNNVWEVIHGSQLKKEDFSTEDRRNHRSDIRRHQHRNSQRLTHTHYLTHSLKS